MKTRKQNGHCRPISIVAIALLVATQFAAAESNLLTLSDEEFDANLSYIERSANIVRKPVDPLAPRIVVESPDIGASVSPPVNVVVRFAPSEDSKIDLDSLKVKYGWFDITERVRDSMTVSPDGIAGQLQSMKFGKYKIRVSIGDTMQRTSNAELEFKIVSVDSGPDSRDEAE